MPSVKQQAAAVYLRKRVFWPLCWLLLLLQLFDAWQDVDALQQEQAYRAQRIADFLAAAASQESSVSQDFSSFQAQVQRVMRNPDVRSIAFVRTQPTIADQSWSLFNLSSIRFQRYAPVEFLVFTDLGARYVPGGYLEVELSLEGGLAQYTQQLKQQLFWSIVLLLLFWSVLWAWSRRAIVPLQRLSGMLEQLLQGQPFIYQPQQAVSLLELNQIELALADLSVQLQTDQRKIEALNLQVEQLSQREQIAQSSRDHFQSMITHELKSPLNAILGGVQLLQASHLDTHQSDNLKLITDGSYYLSRLLDQVLALLSLEQGRVALRYEAFEPVQLLSQLIDEYQKTAFTQQLPLELSIQHSAILLRADVSKIQQVLRLLLDNAFKFTDQGHVRVSAHTEVQSNQMVAWICEVSDTGIGIEPAIQKDIFKPFFQADSSHNRQHEGAGVGLALAQRLTQMMGGVLRVSSQPQQGSQFQLRVPLRTWQQVHQSDSLSSRQMLVYETGLAGELCQLLEQSGMTVQRVQSIEHAIRICKSMSIDGLMICVHVPNIAVKKLLTQLRQQVQHQHVVVIRVVQQSAPIDRAHGYEWGIDHWLTFPLTQQQLVQQLDQWIGC